MKEVYTVKTFSLLKNDLGEERSHKNFKGNKVYFRKFTFKSVISFVHCKLKAEEGSEASNLPQLLPYSAFPYLLLGHLVHFFHVQSLTYGTPTFHFKFVRVF